MSLNKVMLIGNVGVDPTVRYLESGAQGPATGAKVATIRIATTERFRDRSGEVHENTEWHTIVAWRNSADYVEKFVHKGSQIFVEGRLRTRQWQDQTGAARYSTEVVADNIQLLGRRPDAAGQNAGQGAAPAGFGPQAAPAYQQQFGPQSPVGPAPADEGDDMPF